MEALLSAEYISSLHAAIARGRSGLGTPGSVGVARPGTEEGITGIYASDLGSITEVQLR